MESFRGSGPDLEWDERLSEIKVRLVPADVQMGETYWKLIKAVYQGPGEKKMPGGGHHVHFRCLNEHGEDVRGQCVCVGWIDGRGCAETGEGHSASIPLWASFSSERGFGPYYAEVDGVSDKVMGLGLPGGQHVDFLLTFQRVMALSSERQSVIRGVISGGQGLKLILHSDGSQQTATLDPQGQYEFCDLPAGTYRLELEGVGMVREGIQLHGKDAFTFDFPMQSALQGVVRGGWSGLVVMLHCESWGWDRRTALDGEGGYAFSGLPKGLYRLEVRGTVTESITLDGLRVERIDMSLPTYVSSKVLYHYLLFGLPSAPGTQTNLLLAQQYILKFNPTVGFIVGEATNAQYVTIVGDEEAVSAADEERLREAGCKVERLEGDSYALERTFSVLVEMGTRFVAL